MTLALTAAARRVRTPEGAAKYGQPIGTIITKDIIEAAKRAAKAVVPSGGEAPRVRGAEERRAGTSPRDSIRQRIRNWFTAPDMSPDAQKVVDGFDPRTFESDQQAGQYALNRAKPGRFERSPIWSGESHEAIANDSITGFHEAQAAIRKGDTDNPQAKAFTARFQRNSTETPDDLLVSRRVAPDAFPGGVEGLAGKEVHDAAYFQGNLGTPIGDAPVLLTVAVPAGTRAMFTGNGPNDRGVILDRDQRLRVTKVTPDGKGGWYVAAVAVPKTGATAGELKEGTATPDAGALSSDPAVREVQIDNRIRSAYSDMKKAPGGFANMADLRETVDVPRAEFDTAIRRLGNDSDWRVIPVDNRKALSNRDRVAAVRIGEDEANVIAYTPGGRPTERAPLRPLPKAPGTKATRGGPGAPPLLEREAGKRAPGFAQPRGFDEPPTRAAPPTESGRPRTPTEIAEEEPAIRQTKQLPADTVAELNDPKTTISRYRDIAREADIKVPARIIKKADIRDFLLGRKGAPPARARGLRIETPEVETPDVETRKLSTEAVGQLNDPKTTVAQLRKIAKDHGIKVPSTATRKADIRAHLMQAGGVQENPPDMLPEGERNRFRAGWREVSKAPEGLAQAELNEIFLDVHGGRLGVLDAARRLENSAGIDREERDRLRARRGDGEPGAEERKLDDEIAAKEKAAKFLRDYRLAEEEEPAPAPVKKAVKKPAKKAAPKITPVEDDGISRRPTRITKTKALSVLDALLADLENEPEAREAPVFGENAFDTIANIRAGVADGSTPLDKVSVALGLLVFRHQGMSRGQSSLGGKIAEYAKQLSTAPPAKQSLGRATPSGPVAALRNLSTKKKLNRFDLAALDASEITQAVEDGRASRADAIGALEDIVQRQRDSIAFRAIPAGTDSPEGRETDQIRTGLAENEIILEKLRALPARRPRATSSAGTPRAVPRLSRDELEKFNEGQLRVMARNGGVDIPESATRAEIIDALASKPTEAVSPDRLRRIERDAVTTLAKMAMDIEENVAKDAPAEAILHLVRSWRRRLRLHEAEAVSLRSPVERDALAALAEIAKDVEEKVTKGASAKEVIHSVRSRMRGLHLRAVERAGGSVRFDPTQHDPMHPGIPDGTSVLVVRPGYVWDSPDGAQILKLPLVQDVPERVTKEVATRRLEHDAYLRSAAPVGGVGAGTRTKATAPRAVRQIADEHGILDDWATMPASQARSDANASLRNNEDPNRIAERLREEADSLESEESPDMTRGISRSEDDIREARDTDVRNLRRLADAIEQEGAPSSIEEDPFPTLTEDQLRNIAQARGIHVPASATKAEIARLISRGGGEMTGSGAVATPHSTVQIRPALAQATGPRTLARATQAEYKRITGRDLAIDFGTDPDMSMPTAQEHMEGVLRAAEQWPDVDLREVRWFNGELSEPGKQRPWAISANGAIMFSTAYTSKANRERYLGELADGVAGWDNGGTGFHPRGAATPAAVAMHEFGHLIAPERAARNYPGVLRLVQRRAKEDRVPPSRLIRREVSRYADTNPSELVAEAVLDVLINGDAAGQLARQIVELLRTGRL